MSSFQKKTVFTFVIVVLAIAAGYIILVRKEIGLIKSPSRVKFEEAADSPEKVQARFRDMGLTLIPSAKVTEAKIYHIQDVGEKSDLYKLVFFTPAQSDSIKNLYEKRILGMGYEQYRERTIGDATQITAANGTSSITIIIGSVNSSRVVTINLELGI